MVEYKEIRLTEEEIFKYLTENENIFCPSLSSRKHIKDYSKKLHEYAVHFCAFEKGQLVGLVASYFNNNIEKTGFISSVSVIKDYQGAGYATALLMLVINYGIQKNFNSIKLEVKIENVTAIHIFRKTGFNEIARKNNIIMMELKLER